MHPDSSPTKAKISGDFSQFANLNMSGSAQALAAFLEYFSENVKRGSAQAYAPKALEWLDLKLGHRILDAGCGVGRDLRDFADVVGREQRVYGIDKSKDFVAKAVENLHAKGIDSDLRVADVTQIPFADGVFDRVYCERVLQYLPQPREAFAEFFRTLVPGGRVVIFDSDWDTAAINHPDKELTRQILCALTDHHFASGQIGRQLGQLAEEVGFIQIKSQQIALTHSRESAGFVLLNPIKSLADRGVLAAEVVNQWFSDLPRGSAFFASLSGMLMRADKPACELH